MESKPQFGVAFDLDGTLVDNNPYHIQAWQAFYHKRNRTLTTDEYNTNFNGKTNKDVLKYVLERDPTQEELILLTDEKESLYRTIYAAHIKPVNGLLTLLDLLSRHQIPMVIATSGIPVNIEYFFQHIPIRHYFKTVVNVTHITHGKPHPEIYEVAAQKMGLRAYQCIAFEDAMVGVQSAKSAGMKVVALTTTIGKEALSNADYIVPDFSGIDMPFLLELLQNA